MVDKKSPTPLAEDTSISYEIKIRGHLDGHWSDWLGGLEITRDEQGNSLLTGFIPDQAALHGILVQIRDLGLTLVSITPKGIDGETNDENVKRSSE